MAGTRARRRGPRPARLHGPAARSPGPGSTWLIACWRATRTATTRTCRSSCGGPWSGMRIAGMRARHRPVHVARGLAIGDDPVDDPGPAGATVRPGGQPGRGACLRTVARARLRRRMRGSLLLAALDEAMRGRETVAVAPALARAVIDLADRDPRDVTLTRLAARLGKPAGGRAGPGGRRGPPIARAGPPGDARPAGRAQGSGVPRPAPRPGDAR